MNLTKEDFLLARIRDAERMVEGTKQFRILQPIFSNQRYIIELHKNWPVLLTEEPELETGLETSADFIAVKVTQRIDWLTQQAFRSRFGVEPPTAPIIKAMLEPYETHPCFNKEWLA